jgi:hypothetical protein
MGEPWLRSVSGSIQELSAEERERDRRQEAIERLKVFV